VQYIKWAGLRSKDQYWNNTKALGLTKAHIRKVMRADGVELIVCMVLTAAQQLQVLHTAGMMLLLTKCALSMTAGAGTWHHVKVVLCQTEGSWQGAQARCDDCWLQILTCKNVFNGNVYPEEPAIFACKTCIQTCISRLNTTKVVLMKVGKQAAHL
jgi:hypothetical protein